MLVYQIRIQIYNQISIPRIWLKLKLYHAVSLRFSLKEEKIALNMTKFSMHSFLQNGHPNLWSNFNSKKLLKSETSSCGFTKIGDKGVKIAQNVAKVGVHAYLSNVHPNLWSSFNSEKLVKSETPSCIFTRVGLKGGPNSSEHCKRWRACLYTKQASKYMVKF